ncbi:MAG: hypothetical protein PUC68_04130 [Firmicutes bacterium]|nr:hypothetical protein [Bacillota bacterium]
MKKFLVILMIIGILTGCSDVKNSNSIAAGRYFDMIEILKNNEQFEDSSNYFDISYEVSKINDGYRYYVFMDNPRIAMYDIKIIVIEDGVDYSEVMAGNIGIFEDGSYNMIPNQTNIEKGFVKGLSVSGITDKADTSLKVMITWQDKLLSVTSREFFRFNLNYGE